MKQQPGITKPAFSKTCNFLASFLFYFVFKYYNYID